jgi:hypothetical protein
MWLKSGLAGKVLIVNGLTLQYGWPKERPSMRVRLMPLNLLCLAALPLFAQDRGYHVELSDGPKLGSGTLLLVTLVNDSQKPIEAYDAQARCWVGDVWKGGNGTNYDALTIAADSVSSPYDNGSRLVMHNAVLRPGGRMVTQLGLVSQPGCEWKPDVDAVLYADGSYGGDETAARGLQAYRDGVVASVRDWVNTFADPGTLRQEAGVSAESLAAIKAEAQRRVDKDVANRHCTDPLPVCKYWLGRHLIDSNVAGHAKPQRPNESPEQTYQAVTQIVARLNKKIRDDVALEILDRVFPLPPSLAEQDYHPPKRSPSSAP